MSRVLTPTGAIDRLTDRSCSKALSHSPDCQGPAGCTAWHSVCMVFSGERLTRSYTSLRHWVGKLLVFLSEPLPCWRLSVKGRHLTRAHPL